MKREELEKLGLTKEQIDSVLNMHHGEIVPVKENLKKAQDDLTAAQEKVKTTEKALKDFENINPEELNKQISDLKAELAQKDTEHQQQLADRDFNDRLKEGIAGVKGKNPKAIAALLDIESLKASKNQEKDIKEALEGLAAAEDSKMLFGETEVNAIGTGNPIGDVGGNHITSEQKEDADCRAAMGLPPLQEMKGDK